MNFLLSFFFILSLSSLLPTSESTDQILKNCNPKSCGNLINVSFPFWFQNLQPNYCGYPAFELRCDDNTPKLSLPEEDFHVLNISYTERTVTIAAAMNICRVPYFNFYFSLTPFTISSLNRELIFIYNCSKPKQRFVNINCTDNRSYVYIGGSYRIEDSEGFSGSCYRVVMPVRSIAGADVDRYQELLADGFLLNWTAPDCSECRRSNGECGYDNGTENFMCICSDRTHLKSCCKSSASIWFVNASISNRRLCMFIF